MKLFTSRIFLSVAINVCVNNLICGIVIIDSITTVTAIDVTDLIPDIDNRTKYYYLCNGNHCFFHIDCDMDIVLVVVVTFVNVQMNSLRVSTVLASASHS